MKTNIKALTLDFWNTLALQNPLFLEAQYKIVSEATERSLDDVKDIIHQTKQEWYKTELETRGECTASVEVFWAYVFSICKDMKEDVQKSNPAFKNMCRAIVNAFYEYPFIIPEETLILLNEIRNKNIDICIVSNTSRVSGSDIATVLFTKCREYKIENPFTYFLFSDLIQHCKPSLAAFADAINHLDVNSNEVLHFGDKEEFDGTCRRLGFSFQLVESPKHLTLLLKEFLKQLNNA